MSNIDYTDEVPNSKHDYKTRLTAALGKLEFTVESLSTTTGKTMTDATPFLAGLGSAMAITFAFAEQGNSLSGGRWYGLSIGALFGLLLGGAIEGMNIASVYNRDRAYAHNRRTTDETKLVSTSVGDAIVRYSIFVTFGVVFALETVPSAYAWYLGEMQAMHALFRICLIILPFMSRIGAMLFAFVAEINAVDTYARDAKKIAERKEAEEDLIAELDRQRILDDYNREKAEADAKTSARVEKLSGGSSGRTKRKTSAEASGAGVTAAKNEQSDNSTSDNQSDNRRRLILDILTEHISIGATELHRLIGGDEVCTRSTVYEDLKALESDGLIHNADRKWHIGPKIEMEPESVGFSANGVAHDL